jgi:hypothetical protein
LLELREDFRARQRKVLILNSANPENVAIVGNVDPGSKKVATGLVTEEKILTIRTFQRNILDLLHILLLPEK